jgi:DNA transformation protein
MAVSEGFLEYVLEQLYSWDGVTPRKMFGGVGLYRDSKMFGLIADDVIFLKVNDKTREKFIEAGSSPFQPFADKGVMKSYYEVPVDILEDSELLIAWSEESLAIQKSRK